MRPCRRCREPLGNNAATCPRCGAAQDDGPKVNSDPPPEHPRRGFVRLWSPSVGTLLSLALVAAAGAAGYAVAGQTGAAVGVAAVVALFVAVAAWAESGG